MDAERRHRPPPLWLGQLLVFGLLFVLVVGWFFVQTRQAQQAFRSDASEHARLLADAVTLHARGALLAEQVTAAILTGFLGSSARFVDYLDGIAPFRGDELGAFAAEAQLSVIRIVRANSTVQGPETWPTDQGLDCQSLNRLLRRPATHTILFGVAARQGSGCVLVGMDSRDTEALEAAIGLPRALEAVAKLPGVVAVRLEGEPRIEGSEAGATELPRISLRRSMAGDLIAQARAPVAGAWLQLDLDAGPLELMRERLWWEFVGFALVLLLTGTTGSWILYRHQRAQEHQRLGYQRRLSRQREEASLGRAAAAIAHEIRNPLNAMSMGLQRLQLEATELTDEHRHLIELVRQALQHTNATVTGLLDYARPIQPRSERLALDTLIRDQLDLYAPALTKAGRRLELHLQAQTWIRGDLGLLHQVADNLLHNALEAEDPGGAIEVRVHRDRTTARLTITNGGLTAATSELERLLEPWVTTKPSGTGLGLAICQRIITAHGGNLTLSSPRPGRLRVAISLATDPQGFQA